MACKITLTLPIGSYSISLEGITPDSIPSYFDSTFLQLIKTHTTKEEWDNFLEFLKQDLSSVPEESFKVGEDLILANSNISNVLDKFPMLITRFPDIKNLGDVKIRLVSNSISDILLKENPNGEPIYVVSNNPKQISELCRMLVIKDNIENGIIQNLSKEDLDKLNLILNKEQNSQKKNKVFKTIEELLIAYVNSPKDKIWNKDIDINGKIVYYYEIIQPLIKTIEGIYNKPKNLYKSPVVQKIYDRRNSKKNNNSIDIGFDTFINIIYDSIPTLSSNFSKTRLKNILLANYLDFENFNEKDKKDFNQLLKVLQTENFLSQEKVLQLSENPNIEDIINSILSSEPGFPYRFEKITNLNLYMETTYYKISETYGVTIQDILQSKPEDYNGWKIYNINGLYFITENYLFEHSKGKAFNSKKEAKEAIDAKKAQQNFMDDFLFDLYDSKSINTDKSFETFNPNVGDIITKRVNLPIDINVKNNINQEEWALLKSAGNYTLIDFFNLCQTRISDPKLIEKIQKNINTVEKAGLFILLINSPKYNIKDKWNKQNVNNIIKEILNAPIEYYFVESKHKYKSNVSVRLIKISDPKLKDTNEIKYGDKYPIVSFWSRIASVLKNKFGVTAEILTQSEIKQTYGELYSNKKAFLKTDNNKPIVVINTTLGSTEDLFHEYIHILMAYMRETNEDQYWALLSNVWENTKQSKKDKIKDLYKDSTIEQYEENFVKQYAAYITRRYTNGDLTENLFGQLQSSADAIIDDAPGNMDDYADESVLKVFSRFTNDISAALSQVLEFSKDNLAPSVSKLSYLRQALQDKVIEQICN